MSLADSMRQIFTETEGGGEKPAPTALPTVFCVTLPEEPWKRKAALANFHAFGISPVFVEGFQGITLGLRPTNPYDYDLHGNALYMHLSQVGCTLSHRVALMIGISHGASEFIICEDDVKLPENFPALFSSFRAALPEDAEVCQLAYVGSEDKPSIAINDRVRHVYYPFGASCIWWKRSAAKRAVTLMRPIDRPYDVLLIQRVFPFFNHYVPIQPIAGDRSSIKEWPSSVGDAPKN